VIGNADEVKAHLLRILRDSFKGQGCIVRTFAVYMPIGMYHNNLHSAAKSGGTNILLNSNELAKQTKIG
jgi:hypothetical protein